MRRWFSALLAVCVSLSIVSVRADDGMTSFHYMDLYNIEHSAAALQDLKALQIVVYVTSARPGVYPEDITLTMQRASGALETIPHDGDGRALLPESVALKTENPLIVTNQPRHTLNATVMIALVPPANTDLHYAILMQGVTQLNQAIDSQRLGAMAKLYGRKSTGLLLFYGQREHKLTVHRAAGDQVVKSVSVDEIATHLQGIKTTSLPSSTQVIYLPLDAATLKEDPRVTLDALPPQTLPAF